MGNEKDVFQWRRFGHWNTSAAKARLSAFVLWHMKDDDSLREMADECGNRGDADLAMIEAFRRESAVALELVVKAVIAFEMQARHADPASEGVPATHDLPALWKTAGLPELSREDRYRLQFVKSVLLWAGRYATPRSAKAWEEENQAFAKLEDPAHEPGRFRSRAPLVFDWANFDRLYQLAAKRLVGQGAPRSSDRG